RTWIESELFKHDPEAFMAMIRPPGFLVTYDYPPVFALFCMPFTFTDLFGFAAIWWLLTVGLYLLCIMEVTRNLRLKLVLCAAALHFPPFLNHLRFGSTVVIVMGLALLFGSFGIALAGWFKLYPWVLALRRDGRMRPVLAWSAILGIAGLAATHGDIQPFYEWMSNLRQYQHAAGLNNAATWIRVGMALVLLVISLVKRWHPAIVLAIGQGLSPVWWPGYWCAFVPVAAMGIERALERLWPLLHRRMLRSATA
ncbi:DUF2029 domain-containing protein, partial [Candidatus Fermentibacteria bacterium]|nr:DUF2029 domain-containing protein [Candidatus Fermentibacteria bacterium]